MSKKTLKAEHSGVLKIGNADIPCYVLENGERILSTRGVMKAIGRRWRGRKYSGTQLPVFLEANNLKPFISNELIEVLDQNTFKTDKGTISEGFKAKMLPMVCEVYLKARDSGVLKAQQQHIAVQADILMRGLAHVGIIALVDEATGYDVIRDRLALQKILDKYITDEWAKWTKTFPDEFYRELFKLKKIPYPPTSMKRPQYVGHWTNDIVYSRLAPGVLKNLKKKNPRQPAGYRKKRFHQFLTRDWGYPELRDYLSKIIFLMKSCTTWEDFKRRLNRSAPKYGDTMPLDFPGDY
ncbi:MAG: P63C domain-containing protein [Deltaproteobacteria bacterium]|nr:P63C domain-containing protein [Deltaproteobacteria bacterium]